MAKKTLTERTEALKAALGDFFDAIAEAASGGSAAEPDPEPAPRRTRRSEPEPDPEPAPKATNGKSKKDAPTQEQVREKLLEVIEEFGNDECKRILKEHDVAKVSELKESDYASVIEACEAALKDSDKNDD